MSRRRDPHFPHNTPAMRRDLSCRRVTASGSSSPTSRRRSSTAAWRHSMSSTKKTPEHFGGRTTAGHGHGAVVPAAVAVAGVRERCLLSAASSGPAGALAFACAVRHCLALSSYPSLRFKLTARLNTNEVRRLFIDDTNPFVLHLFAPLAPILLTEIRLFSMPGGSR